MASKCLKHWQKVSLFEWYSGTQNPLKRRFFAADIGLPCSKQSRGRAPNLAHLPPVNHVGRLRGSSSGIQRQTGPKWIWISGKTSVKSIDSWWFHGNVFNSGTNQRGLNGLCKQLAGPACFSATESPRHSEKVGRRSALTSHGAPGARELYAYRVFL